MSEFKLPCDLKIGSVTFEKGVDFDVFKKALDRHNVNYLALVESHPATKDIRKKANKISNLMDEIRETNKSFEDKP